MMNEVKVTILSKKNCYNCEVAKKMFERLKQAYNLNVSIVDITSEQGQLLSGKIGLFFPPGVLFNNVPFAFGKPSEKKIRKELSRLSTTHKR